MHAPPLVALIARAPEHDRVKTRLAASIGPSRALELYRWLGARVFAKGIMLAKSVAATRPVWLRLAVVGPSMIGLFVLMRLATGESLTLGSGYAVIRWATTGDHTMWVLAAVLVTALEAECAVKEGAQRAIGFL